MFLGSQCPHAILMRGREGQSHRWTRPPAGCDDGAGAVSQGRGASRRWKRPEMVLPKASGRPSPALPFLGLASKAQFVTAATGN